MYQAVVDRSAERNLLRMKKYSLIGLLILTSVISGCGEQSSNSPVTPAPDRPTFLYFYTEG
jgi:hypothetical protein